MFPWRTSPVGMTKRHKKMLMIVETYQRKKKIHKYKHKIRNYLHVKLLQEDPR